MQKRLIPYLLMLSLTACGGSGNQITVSEGTSNPPAVLREFGSLRILSELSRAIPVRVDSLEFVGFDAQGRSGFGPVRKPKASSIVLEQVPVEVVRLVVRYYEGDILRGSGEHSVQVVAGRETVLSGLSFEDVSYAVTGLEIQSGPLEVPRGQRRQLAARVSYADRTSAELHGEVSWSSLDPAVAEIGPDGFVQARAVGRTVLRAEFSGRRAEVPIQVIYPNLQSIRMVPGDVTLIEGDSLQLSLYGLYADNLEEPLDGVEWLLTPSSQAELSSSGELRALQAGSVQIRARKSGLEASATIQIAENTALSDLRIVPDSVQVPKGFSGIYKAVARNFHGDEVDVTQSVLWSSGDENVAVTPGDLAVKGYFEGKAEGDTVVRAQLDSMSDEASVSVGPAVPAVVTVMNLGTAVLEPGQTRRFSGQALMTDRSFGEIGSDIFRWLGLDGVVQFDSAGVAEALAPGVLIPVRAEPLVSPYSTYVTGSIPLIVSLSTPAIVVNRHLARSWERLSAALDISTVADLLTVRGDRFLAPAGARLTWFRLLSSPGGPLTQSETLDLPATGSLVFAQEHGFRSGGAQATFFAGQRKSGQSVDYGLVWKDGAGPYQYQSFSDAANGVSGACVADFNGDGRPDVALSHAAELKVRCSQSGLLDRLFTTPLSHPGMEIVSSDLNGDGFLDLVVQVNDSGDTHLEIYRGDGSGDFAHASTQPFRANEFAVGDVTNDGKPDIITLSTLEWSVHPGSGDFQFGPPLTGAYGFSLTHSGYSPQIRLGDVTGDGRLDMVIGNPGSSFVSLFPGEGAAFGLQEALDAQAQPRLVQLHDQNGDGKLDVCLLTTLLGPPDPNFQPFRILR